MGGIPCDCPGLSQSPPKRSQKCTEVHFLAHLASQVESNVDFSTTKFLNPAGAGPEPKKMPTFRNPPHWNPQPARFGASARQSFRNLQLSRTFRPYSDPTHKTYGYFVWGYYLPPPFEEICTTAHNATPSAIPGGGLGNWGTPLMNRRRTEENCRAERSVTTKR